MHYHKFTNMILHHTLYSSEFLFSDRESHMGLVLQIEWKYMPFKTYTLGKLQRAWTTKLTIIFYISGQN